MPGEPPIVTITDPSQPGPIREIDVSGDDREPWRPSSFQGVGIVAALVLGAGLLGAGHLRQVRDDRSRDLAGVHLSLPPADSGAFLVTSGYVQALTVRNAGGEADRILSLTVAGYPRQAVEGSVIPAHGQVDLGVELPLRCHTATRPTVVTLEIQTPAGHRTSVRLDVSRSSFADVFRTAYQDSCVPKPLAQTLDVDAADVTGSDARSVTVAYRLLDVSKGDVTVTRVEAPDGFAATAGLPVLVHDVDDGQPSVVEVTFSVTDCGPAEVAFPAFIRRANYDGGDNTPSFDLSRGAEQAEFELPIDYSVTNALGSLVRSAC